MIDMEKRCRASKGKKVVRGMKKLSVEIDKGSPDGEQYTIHGEGDQVPDVEPGDVIVVVKIRPNKIFKRKGADLYMEKEISLLEALTGVDFTLMHLDGRVVRIQSANGEVIKPNQTMTCEGLGMPFHKTTYKNGNLFINFVVNFPESVSEGQATQVKQILKEQSKSA